MILFVFEVVRVDVVGLLMMVLLPLSGVITASEAISGLSSNAVVSIIAVIIIGEGLDKTGVMNIFANNIIKYAGAAYLIYIGVRIFFSPGIATSNNNDVKPAQRVSLGNMFFQAAWVTAGNPKAILFFTAVSSCPACSGYSGRSSISRPDDPVF